MRESTPENNLMNDDIREHILWINLIMMFAIKKVLNSVTKQYRLEIKSRGSE
jgi:hypothetical protein